MNFLDLFLCQLLSCLSSFEQVLAFFNQTNCQKLIFIVSLSEIFLRINGGLVCVHRSHLKWYFNPLGSDLFDLFRLIMMAMIAGRNLFLIEFSLTLIGLQYIN
jgi:hypothetical protein